MEPKLRAVKRRLLGTANVFIEYFVKYHQDIEYMLCHCRPGVCATNWKVSAAPTGLMEQPNKQGPCFRVNLNCKIGSA